MPTLSEYTASVEAMCSKSAPDLDQLNLLIEQLMSESWNTADERSTATLLAHRLQIRKRGLAMSQVPNQPEHPSGRPCRDSRMPPYSLQQ